jgi:hypothetical protein
MPHQSRSQRRRQPARTQQRRAAERMSSESLTAVRPSEGQPSRPSRLIGRRMAAEPPDYSRDYAYVRSDLVWITIWASLLFAGMIAVSFVI